MAKRRRQTDGSGSTGNESFGDQLMVEEPSRYDHTLATLFENSLGPANPVFRSLSQAIKTGEIHTKVPLLDTSGKAGITGDNIPLSVLGDNKDSLSRPAFRQFYSEKGGDGSRKRKHREDDIEGKYLNQLAREEDKEERSQCAKTHTKRQKLPDTGTLQDDVYTRGKMSAQSIKERTENEDHASVEDVPQHESVLVSEDNLDLEKSSRTVFLANISTLAIKSKTAKRTLLEHLSSFTSSLPKESVNPGIESLRFRSTAFATSGAPKKAAYAKKDLMDTTTQSTNAYAVYTTGLAARVATKKLNGSIVLGRHLRVDSVAHPTKIDNRRCVFVGNLGFVDDETNINAIADQETGKSRRKPKEPADVEEGLWKHFERVGEVENVRVVRDKITRVGKGFAYVQFVDGNSVEKALLYNGEKFPPMLPRILRVRRAKNFKKAGKQSERKPSFKQKTSYHAKVESKMQSLGGRAERLFGRAGAAQVRADAKKPSHSSNFADNAHGPKLTVLEGRRAREAQGKGLLKKGGLRTSQRTRSSRRSADFKAKGRKKVRT